jgi:hypothetical protein
MFSRQIDMTTLNCPDCGSKLASERDLFRCEEHGTFFMYGSQLLVRAPRQDIKLHDSPLPREDRGSRYPR